MPRLFFFLIFPFLPGCLAFGYPSTTYTPTVASLPSDVHVFKSTFSTGGKSIIMTGGERVSWTIEEIPISDGQLDSLHHAYFAYFIGGFPVSYSEHQDWKLMLYRPGFEIIEVPSRWFGRSLVGPTLDKLDWIPAKDIGSQLAILKTICPDNLYSTASPEVRQIVDQERERLGAHAAPNLTDSR
jgi:hypothetical protein